MSDVDPASKRSHPPSSGPRNANAHGAHGSTATPGYSNLIGSSGAGMREVALVKNGLRFVFRYVPGDEGKLLATLAQMARDPECDLGWFDAAVLSHQMGQGMHQELRKRMKT